MSVAKQRLGAPVDEAEEGASSSPYLQQEPWARLGAAPSRETFASAWLELQCRLIGRVGQAVALLRQPQGTTLEPVAFWPHRFGLSVDLTTVAELAASEKRGTVRDRGDAGSRGQVCAYPVLVDDELHGVVAVELEPDAGADIRVVMRQLQWGSAWLESLVLRKHPGSRDQLVRLLDLLACALDHQRFQEAATALATELGLALSCDQVSIGFLDGKHVRVRAISHSANIGKKTNMVRSIAAAMDEAVEQQATLRLPPVDGPVFADRAHKELARAFGARSLLSVSMHEAGRPLGAITLARSRAQRFDAKEVALCEQLAAMAGPVLEAKRLNDRWLPRKVWDSTVETLRNLFGPRHPGLKLATVGLVAVVAFLSLATGTYRVSADAVLEGTVRRVVTAPMDGYVGEALARAGDMVRAGETMASLEDDELRLEQVRWLSQKAQLKQQYSAALAGHERSQVRVLGAQLEQAQAQLALIGEQLARVRIGAPFDGLVVSGDLSQSLGSPVERGQVLFEVAPLDSYRVVLQVDERDIAWIAVGQEGRLLLSGLPRQPIPFHVETVTPVARSEEGKNVFRVEGLLDDSDPRLRPGMEGVAKVEIGERRLIWIWTHRAWSWLRMQLWLWWPHA